MRNVRVTRDTPRNLAASVRQRLANIAHDSGEEFQFVLTRFAIERFLYRLSRSAHANTFVLKGATLFQLWGGHPHRPTRDLDLLARGEPSTERYERLIRDVCRHDVERDALTYSAESVRAVEIKKGDEYQGVRVRLEARLGNARIQLQIDIGFGDVITPD